MNKIILILVVVAVLGFVFVFGRMNRDGVLHITQHGEEIFEVDGETIDINVNKNFVINSENGFNEIEIKDGQIRVASADCPDQTCVNCGFISKDSFNKIIACIPHRLIIEFR